ncbi:hypothetical protein [Pseudomonas moraviensis]|uniref:Uncharacterized protein n=1 Tax=Pseudomonas moraviensis R28-S TaxID=1395516 RepID=V8R9W6_9PSED|nr:hypothetical protein [Pseudomonas moraviensis]ETF08350.1 hypothetical protein PMO01_05005 [Pseudomonas moraviensis R28-S]
MTQSETDYFSQERVHTVEDGRGERLVFLDGTQVQDAFFADTQLGLVVAYCDPVEVIPGTDRIDSYHAWGDVRVSQVPT